MSQQLKNTAQLQPDGILRKSFASVEKKTDENALQNQLKYIIFSWHPARVYFLYQFLIFYKKEKVIT